MKNALFLIFPFLVIVSFFGILNSEKVKAVDAGYRNPANAREKLILDNCNNYNSSAIYYSWSAMWFSSPGDGYFQDAVVYIPHDAKEVTISLRGSNIQCKQTANLFTFSRARHTSSGHEWIKVKDPLYTQGRIAGKIKNPDQHIYNPIKDEYTPRQNDIFRIGRLDNNSGLFSTGASSRDYVLDVSNIPRGRQTVWVGVYRCGWLHDYDIGRIYSYPTNPNGREDVSANGSSCGTIDVPIEVNREAPPLPPYSLSAGSRVSRSASYNSSGAQENNKSNPMTFRVGSVAYFPQMIKNGLRARDDGQGKPLEWINIIRKVYNEDGVTVNEALTRTPRDAGKDAGLNWWYTNGSTTTSTCTILSTAPGVGSTPSGLRYFAANETKYFQSSVPGRDCMTAERITPELANKIVCYSLNTGYVDGDKASGGITTPEACAKILPDFTLVPDIKINSSYISSQVGTGLSLSTFVDNTGTTPSVPNTVWKLGYVLARNNIGTSNNLRTTSNDICSMGVISGVSEVCGDVTEENAGAMSVNRNNIDTSGLNPTNTGAGRTTVRRNIDLGQYVCYYLAVKPHATAANQDEWRVAIDCKPVAKTPSVHVFGGDVALRNTNLSKDLVDISNFKDNENKIYGSWIEYALISAGRVNKNNSSAGYSLSGVVDSLSSRGNLIFANTGTACNVAIGIGCFADRSSVDSAFKSTGPRTAPSMGSEDNGNGGINGFDHNKLYNRSRVASASVNIQGEVRGRSVVNAANKVVKITGNITNQPTAENYSKIPQLIIFAKDVQISSNVTNVDAWILATGNVFTCDSKTRPANSNECNKPLRVNGAIQAQKLYLSRTAGGDVDSMNQAAEVINLSATSRLSAIGRAEDDSSGPSGSTSRSVWETTFVRELPPRY